MFELKNVTKFYNNNGVVTLGLRNINLKLEKNEIVAITGDSGSGKSTLLNVISGVDTYEEGEILFYGNETSYFDQNDMDTFRKNNIAFIFQKYNIIESYTVLENVMIPLLLNNENKASAKAKALEIIAKVGLTDRIKHKGSKLSGGEKQRCVIARALASDAKVLACDEPTGNLDSETGKEIIKLIKEVSKDKLVLIVTHNFDQVKDIATRKIKLSDGEIVEDTVYQSQNIEENQAMDLSKNKVKAKHTFNFAFKNILSTPKKTTLVSLVFFVVSFLALFLSLSMFAVFDIGSSSPKYCVLEDNRIVTYDKEHKDLDPALLEKLHVKEIYYNAFYEDEPTRFALDENTIIESSITRHKMSDLKIVEGELNEDKLCLVIPTNFGVENYKNILNKNLYTTDDFNQKYTCLGQISSIGTSKKINLPLLYSKQYSEKVINAVLNQHIEAVYNQSTSVQVLVDIQNSTSKIEIPHGFDAKNIEILLGRLYSVNYDIPTVETDVTVPYLRLGKDFFNGDLKPVIGVKEAVLYVDNVVSAKKQLNKIGYKYTIPAQANQDGMMNKVLVPFFMVNIIIILVVLYFVCFAILSKIYVSKGKDYSILRTLGLEKKDLSKIVIIETLTIGVCSCILSLILLVIIGFAAKLSMVAYLNVWIILIYLLLITLFSYLLGRRFNNKLYKSSVNETLKEGEN